MSYDRIPIKLNQYGFDTEIEITQEEIACCNDVIKTGNIKASWIKHLSHHSNAQETSYYACADKWVKQPRIALYIQYLKAGIASQLQLNTDLIARKIALQLHVNLTHFIKENGERKNLHEISDQALSATKVKMKFNSRGEPTGNTEIELPSSLDVINALVKLSEVDSDLVKSLKAKMGEQKVKLRKS